MGKNKKMKEFLKKHGQVIRYLYFGITTTVVGWVVYFGVLFLGKAVLSIPTEDTSSAKYLLAYTVAQVTQWIASVLVAFFTNRKWVFTHAERDKSTIKQLCIFSGGRVLTFVLDYGVTYFGALLLCTLLPIANNVLFWGREWNFNEITAKLISAVIVIIGNYFFSKRLVFKETREEK